MTEKYKLIFGGLQDTTTDTLRKVRGVLVGELGLSIEEAKKILLEAPVPMLSDKSEKEILFWRDRLEQAGAMTTLTGSHDYDDSTIARKSSASLTTSVSDTTQSYREGVDKFWQELEGSCLVDISPSILRDVKGYNPIPSRGDEPKESKTRKPDNICVRALKWLNRDRVLSVELTFSLGFSIALLVLSMATA